ncbi:MAG: hypothetical protein ABIO50_10030 [Nitrosospira sp.]
MSRKLSCAVKIGTDRSDRDSGLSRELPADLAARLSFGPSNAKVGLMSVTGKPGWEDGEAGALILSKRV